MARITRTSLEGQLLQLRTEFGEYAPGPEIHLEYNQFCGYRLYKIIGTSGQRPLTDYMTGKEMYYHLKGWHDALGHCLKEVLRHKLLVTE